MKYDEEWYNKLSKPKFQPPARIFAPVWLFLYILMAVSFVLVLLSPFKLSNIVSYLFFIAQIIVNISWPEAFFKEHNLRKAFLLAVLLAFLVFITMILFFKISKLAGLMFLPYFLWCAFASVLSYHILDLNEW